MNRIFHYQISDLDNGKPIDLFLKSMGYSSQNIISLKKMPESILVNEKWEYVNHVLKTGDLLTIHIQENTSSENIVPSPIPLDIIYEDDDILVVNKPANMPIHPSQNNYDNTLANAVMYYFAKQGIPYVFRCVNRLDRDTTGLTILAKHMLSSNILSSMVQRREIKREYIAIVDGVPSPSEGVINAPIARVNGSTIEREVNPLCGEKAVTHYRILKSVLLSSLHNNSNLQITDTDTYSLVSLWLETGRTHQIRVHMKYHHTPLVGDFLYHPDMRFIQRQALHSYCLTFKHPITKKELSFTAPIPADMRFIFQ